MLRKFQISFLLLCCTVAISCSSSDDTTYLPPEQTATFEILQSIPEVQEQDEVTFSINSNVNVTAVTWYLNGSPIIFNSTLTQIFDFPGTQNISAEVEYSVETNPNTILTTTVLKTLTVNEAAKYLVKIKKVAILSFSGQGDFYSQDMGYNIMSVFTIHDGGYMNLGYLRYTSPVNSENWVMGSTINYPISWEISEANYSTTVYQTANIYPNHQPGFHAMLTFYGAKRFGVNANNFSVINTLFLDLNPYRTLMPETISINNEGMQIECTLEWTQNP